jgi:hypothetical protein
MQQGTKHYPQNLLRNRVAAGYKRAIDLVTEALVGYARWILSEAFYTAENGQSAWAGAQVPAVSKA